MPVEGGHEVTSGGVIHLPQTHNLTLGAGRRQGGTHSEYALPRDQRPKAGLPRRLLASPALIVTIHEVAFAYRKGPAVLRGPLVNQTFVWGAAVLPSLHV